MVEILVLAALSATASLAIARSSTLPRPPAIMFGPVIGVAGYVGVVALLVSSVGHARPAVAAGVTCAGLLAVAARPGGDTLRSYGSVGMLSAAATGVAGIVVGALNGTRLTLDSLSYIAVADILVEPDAISRLRPATIEARNLTTGAVHTLGTFDGRPYAEAATPIITIFGTLGMLWLLHRALAGVGRRIQLLVTGATAVFCLAAGRPLYDAFYVNSHGPVMVWFFTMVVAAHLVSVDRGWPFLAAVAAPAVLVARPEGPILVALGMLPLVTSGALPVGTRTWSTVPNALVAVTWFGAVARAHPDLVSLAPTDPVVPAIAISLGLVAVAPASTVRVLAPLTNILPWAAASVLAAVFALGAVTDPDAIATTIEATAVNLTTSGGWGMTWVALLVLMGVAAANGPPREGRMLAPIVGFLSLYWASSVLRNGAYRIGTGDSGNRMLAHVFLVVVFYVVVSTTTHSFAQESGVSASRSSAA